MHGKKARPSVARIVLGAVGAAVLLTACQQGPAEPRYEAADALAGRWHWVSSLNVETQQILTPASEGFEAELTFTVETDGEGTFTYVRTGAPDVVGEFGIASEDASGNDFIVISQSIDFLRQYAWLAAGPDTLNLGGVMEGGYNSRYVRVQQ